MATDIGVNIGSGNGLLPDGTKPLPEPVLTDHQQSPGSDILIRAISQEMPQTSISKVHLKITYLKFHSNFPGANELMNRGPGTQQLQGIMLSVQQSNLSPPLHCLTKIISWQQTYMYN